MMKHANSLKEKAFEAQIEKELVLLHGYRRRDAKRAFDSSLALDRDLLFEFLTNSQAEKIKTLRTLFGDAVRERILQRLDGQINMRGIIDVIRNGIEEGPVKLELAFFKPVTSLNPEVEKLYKCNIFSIMRQVRFSPKTEQAIDMVIFLNGIPLITAELKNELTGQTVHHAIMQYKTSRNPSEKLLSFKRCIAHFAVDTSEVYVTTHLREERTYFLPFNRGFNFGAGNPPVEGKYKTYYLWEDVWSPDNWSDLLQSFAHFYIDVREDRMGKSYRVPVQIFPRYHQWKTVINLLKAVQGYAVGKNYLIHHSAGSGKSMTIAWLVYRLAELHTPDNEKIFDSVIVLTDRRLLDKQLRDTISAFQSQLGVLTTIGDKDTSAKLREALETGAKIITTTIQKFPVIVDTVGTVPSKKFALIVDEAHSSQSGEMTRAVHQVLDQENPEDWLLQQVKARKQPANISYFAFTATPKRETLELFGEKQHDSSFVPFSLYPMKQAIEEKFIFDVLTNYTTYKTYFRLIKKASEDPTVSRKRALTAILRYVNLHDITLDQKIDIIMAHFENSVRSMLLNEAKAMIITFSREAVVRYRLALDYFLRKNNLQYKALAAFTGTINVDGVSYTETSINNGIPENNTAREFKKPEYRFLIVAEKFQTGFNEPFLCAIYVDKRLSGVNAVQTLSRLNRIAREKDQVFILDFVNDTDEIKKAFEPYYISTILSEKTNINALNDLRHSLFQMFELEEKTLDVFIGLLDPTSDEIHEQANAFLDNIANEIIKLDSDQYKQFRAIAGAYIKRYPFMAQVVGYIDLSHEKLYIFLKCLVKKLPHKQKQPLAEIIKYLDLDTVRVVQKIKTSIQLDDMEGDVKKDMAVPTPIIDEDFDPLSKIIDDLNKHWGVAFGLEQQSTLTKMGEELVSNTELQDVISNNPKQNAEIHFEKLFIDKIDDQFDFDRKLWEQLTNNKELFEYVKKSIFRYVYEKTLLTREMEY